MKIGLDFVGITTPFYCHDGMGNFVLHKRSIQCRDEWGKWDPGSGKLDFGVSLEDNVLREVMEEYCVAGNLDERLPAHDIFRIQDGIKTHWIAIPFIVKVEREKVKIGEPNKAEELGWFRLDNLPQPLHSGFEHTLTKYRNYFEKYEL
jgi:8-oxo-dGTP diphosphatase